jgi:hypothetical protein
MATISSTVTPGRLGQQVLEHDRHQVLRQRRHAADADRRPQAARMLAQLARRVFDHDRHLARAGQQHGAGGRQAHVASAPFRTAGRPGRLEPVDAFGQRRLGAEQLSAARPRLPSVAMTSKYASRGNP